MNDFKDYSNIIQMNGAMDPWVIGQPHKAVNLRQPVIWIKDGAHHVDQFLPQSNDQHDWGSVGEAQQKTIDFLRQWMWEYIEQGKTMKGGLAQQQSQAQSLSDQRYHRREHPFNTQAKVTFKKSEEVI